jgi:MFS family permease
MNAYKNPNPVVSFQDIKTRRLVLPSLSVTLRNFAHNGVTFVLVLYLTNIHGKSPSAVGTILLFYSMALMVGVPLGGWFADRWVSRKAGGFGLAIQASGMLWLGLVPSQSNYLLALPGMILGGLGAGLCLTSFTKEAVASLGKNKVGLASGLYNMIRFSGAAASAPILGILLARGFEQFGGIETVPQPYLSSFIVLAFVALTGILVSILIPPPPKKEEMADSEA